MAESRSRIRKNHDGTISEAFQSDFIRLLVHSCSFRLGFSRLILHSIVQIVPKLHGWKHRNVYVARKQTSKQIFCETHKTFCERQKKTTRKLSHFIKQQLSVGLSIVTHFIIRYYGSQNFCFSRRFRFLCSSITFILFFSFFRCVFYDDKMNWSERNGME